jgi:1-acyl-sn-glycerol-3-phosphate acyltransferase
MKLKPRKGGRGRRRAMTITVYALTWLFLSLLIPIWVPVALLIGLVRRRSFILLRLLLFAWFYFGLELVALLLIASALLTSRSTAHRDERLYALQAWWASLNLGAARRLLRLRIEVDGADVPLPGPTILLIRHASILDTLLPCTYVQRPFRYRVRYILKQELLVDPCIDIVGNTLPNYFVDRTGDTAAELEGIRRLVRDLGTDGVLIFPEGTRFSPQKRKKILASLSAEQSEMAGAARALAHVLPPKPGGVLALIDALPNVDCVFLAHGGLETFAKIGDLMSGQVVGSTVRIKLWRIAADEIPSDRSERLAWLYAQWSKVDEFVGNAVDVS